MKKLRVLDLFSGIGGFSLGLERTGGFETVAFCEIEEFPRKILAKHWPDVPCHKDVRELKGEDVGPVDVICGGYPCQPFSTAGKRFGAEDDRHLWPEYCRLVEELRPTWVIGENVAGHVSMGLDNVLSDLEALGYATRTFIIPACAVGAFHRRDRTWIVAHTDIINGRTEPQQSICGKWEARVEHSGRCADVANPSVMQRDGGEYHTRTGERQEPQLGKRSGEVTMANPNQARLQGREKAGGLGSFGQGLLKHTIGRTDGYRTVWSVEPNVGRVAHGVPNRVDRLKALGNAVVPQIPEMIGRAILEAA